MSILDSKLTFRLVDGSTWYVPVDRIAEHMCEEEGVSIPEIEKLFTRDEYEIMDYANLYMSWDELSPEMVKKSETLYSKLWEEALYDFWDIQKEKE